MIHRSRAFIIAHRGYSELYPENTLLAFRAALAPAHAPRTFPVRGIELDIHLSADGKAVVIHDFATGRTAWRSGKRADWAGKAIRRLTLAELRRYDVGHWKGGAFSGERIPLLETVFRRLGKKTVLYVELKMKARFERRLAEEAIRLVKKYRLEQHVVLHSFHPRLGSFVKATARDIKTGFLFGSMADLRGVALADYDFLHPHWKICIASPRRFLELGKPVNAWTVESWKDAELLLASPIRAVLQGIMVNDLRIVP